MTHKLIDLFCGIGGFSLAAHSLGMETALFCDSKQHSPYVWQVIPRHFPGVYLHDDVTTLTKEVVEDALADAAGEQSNTEHGGYSRPRERRRDTVDPRQQAVRPQNGAAGDDGPSRRGEALILTAGFPCQDLSYAGQGAGLEGERSGLYREVIRIVRDVRPDWLLLENVAAILTRGVGTVLGDLAASGYGWAYCCVPACAVGAPHRRDRWWAVAWPTLGDSEDRARGERIVTSVLRGLTPFGDLADGWPTATASDAWAGDHNRSQTIPCNGRVLTGKAGLGLGQAARGDTWPTPTKRDHKDGGYCESVPVNALLGRAVWPTPRKSCAHGASASEVDAGDPKKRLEVEVGQQASGSLNPEFVETLMGYPIGYTEPSGDALLTLPGVWPGSAPDGVWLTPTASDGSCGSVIGANDTFRDTASGRPRKVTQNGTDGSVGLARMMQVWPAGLGAPQHDWEPPRLTTVKENRANRLKAMGNSIVPQVARLWLAAIKAEDLQSL